MATAILSRRIGVCQSFQKSQYSSDPVSRPDRLQGPLQAALSTVSTGAARSQLALLAYSRHTFNVPLIYQCIRTAFRTHNPESVMHITQIIGI